MMKIAEHSWVLLAAVSPLRGNTVLFLLEIRADFFLPTYLTAIEMYETRGFTRRCRRRRTSRHISDVVCARIVSRSMDYTVSSTSLGVVGRGRRYYSPTDDFFKFNQL